MRASSLGRLAGAPWTVAASLLIATVVPAGSAAQIRVNPTGVSVSASSATTVFLTFGGLRNHAPMESVWCGELISAAPDIGVRCDPRTIFGRLPARYDLVRASGRGAVTDIMSIPPSVAMRAYQAAAEGARSTFFYVRRFENLAGGPDEYVAVTCRLTGGGARTPFALTNVALSFDTEVPVMTVAPGGRVPSVVARLAYTGTGRLKGRWEIVLPGEEPPNGEDLLTEATLPAERRGTQHRYTQVERFNVFLPPNGKAELPGPPRDRLPTDVQGTYLLLLRIESDNEREGDSDLGAVGAGDGVVHSGTVAGFPIPPLRYVVGAAESSAEPVAASRGGMVLLLPRDSATVGSDSLLLLRWREHATAARYRVELVMADGAEPLFTAFVRRGVTRYAVPPFARARASGRDVRWRVSALGETGNLLQSSAWRRAAVHQRPAPRDSTHAGQTDSLSRTGP